MAKKALVIVPHQDDETCLAGNIIGVIKSKYEVYVMYSSLESDEKKGNTRKCEAINACAVWGIPKSNIIFLNYPDTPNSAGKHWYQYDRKKVIEDIKSYILRIRPSIIFATDFDFHSDHRMISLAFDNAMGQLLKDYREYRPLVLKGFCYETAFYSEEDYKASCPGLSVSNISPLSNPSYEWEKRISIFSDERAGVIWKRKAFKALAKHKSQYAILHAKSIINDDNVFWVRRTDNLLVEAALTSSVDAIEKIRDFIVLDTDDIITVDPRKINYDKSVIRFEKGDYIKAEWRQVVFVDRIVFHGSINQNKDTRINILVTVNGEIKHEVVDLKPYGRETLLNINKDVKELYFEFQSGPIELSEIEVLNGNVNNPFKIIRNQSLASFVDVIDKIGYTIIVFFIRLRRKIKNTLQM